MSFELGRALLATDTITPEALADAFLTCSREGVSLVRALLMTHAIDPTHLETALWRSESPSVRAVVPDRQLVARLPHDLCTRLLAIPVGRHPITGTIDVAVADLRDAQGAIEIGHLLNAKVRALRAPIAAIERALKTKVEAHGFHPASGAPGFHPASGPPGPKTGKRAPTPVYGEPASAPVDAHVRRPAPSTIEPPPSEELALPLMRRPGRPSLPSIPNFAPKRTAALVLDDAEAREELAAEGLGDSGEQRIEKREQTLLPPPAEALPPPPNIGPRPPTFEASHTIPAGEPPPRDASVPSSARASQHPRTSDLPLLLTNAGSILAQMRAATDRDMVIDVLVAGTRTVARKVAIFVVRKDEFVGWTCTPEFGDEAVVRTVTVRGDVPSVLSVAAQNGSYLGPMHRTEAHAAILHAMGSASRDVAIVPVRVSGRPALMVLADDLGDTMIATRRMEELATAAGDALARIVRERADRP